jgi:hypothetical protein
MVDQIYPILPKIDAAADALIAEQKKLLAESRISAGRQVSLSTPIRKYGDVLLGSNR